MSVRRNSVAIAIALTLVSLPASAHDVFGLNAAPFWLGALHLIVAPLGVASIIALAAAIAFSDGGTIVGAVIVAGVTAFVTAVWAPASLAAIAPIGIILAGLSAASGLEPRRWLGVLLGALTGFSAGAAAQLDVRAISAAAGVAVAMTSAALWGVEAFVHTRRFVPLARRVAGAWMAAIALLLGALAIRLLLSSAK
jgi:hypothetical protein